MPQGMLAAQWGLLHPKNEAAFAAGRLCPPRLPAVILKSLGGHELGLAVADRMDTLWPNEFRERMRTFEGRRKPHPGEAAVSIKLRVNSGCFHREHSPHAYEMIDQKLRKLAKTDTELTLQEHETGPEVLAYILLATAGLSLAKEVVGLITEIVKARNEGIERGDRANEPLHLVVRRVHDKDGIRDEQVLTIGHTDTIDEEELRKKLNASIRKLLKDGEQPETKAPAAKKRLPQRKNASCSFLRRATNPLPCRLNGANGERRRVEHATSRHERHRTTFNSQGLVPGSSVFSKANTSSRAAKISPRATRTLLRDNMTHSLRK